MAEYVVYAWGHENIRANHKTTWQITREEDITVKGDCIIGVRATASTNSLPLELKEFLMKGQKLVYSICVDDEIVKAESYGDPDLTLDDPIDIVMRKSKFISSRTIAIQSSLTAMKIPRSWLKKLQNPETQIRICFYF